MVHDGRAQKGMATDTATLHHHLVGKLFPPGSPQGEAGRQELREIGGSLSRISRILLRCVPF